jgi:beta-glucosidase
MPSILDYDIISAGMTYMYYDGTPLYPFGHGLSYSTFEYSNLKTNGKAVGGNGKIKVSVDVTNTGDVPGDEVVQLYTAQQTSRDTVADRQLREFERISLEPGETTTVTFEMRAGDLARWDVTRETWVVERADYAVMVGASSSDIREQATLRVKGEVIPPRDLSQATRAENFDDYAGIELVDESKERGTSVEGDDGAWAKFADAGLPAETATFTAEVAKASSGTGSIEVRLDSPTGPLAGTATVDSTGDVYAYTTVSAALSGAEGNRDVYLVFDGEVRLASFTID